MTSFGIVLHYIAPVYQSLSACANVKRNAAQLQHTPDTMTKPRGRKCSLSLIQINPLQMLTKQKKVFLWIRTQRGQNLNIGSVMLWMNGAKAQSEFNVILPEMYLEVRNAGRCFSGCKAVSAKQSPVSFVLFVFPFPQSANDISCCAVIQDSTSFLVYNLPEAKLFLTAHLLHSQNLQ